MMTETNEVYICSLNLNLLVKIELYMFDIDAKIIDNEYILNKEVI